MDSRRAYKRWSTVPDHLKTKTQLGKEGMKPGRDQEIAAWKDGQRDRYALYDINEAVPKRKMSPAQKEALAAARLKAMTTDCCNRYVGRVNWWYKDGLCASCWHARKERRHRAFLARERDEAINWARRLLAEEQERAIVLDTETTGLGGRSSRLPSSTWRGGYCSTPWSGPPAPSKSVQLPRTALPPTWWPPRRRSPIYPGSSTGSSPTGWF